MTGKTIRILIISVLVILVGVLTAVPAQAFEERSGVSVTVGAGEVINGDLYLAGTTITIDGTVNGDVFGLGQTIVINGTVNGGITLAAQSITVSGQVSSGARIAGQSVTVNGNIGRDLIVASSDVTVNPSAVVGGDVNLYASTAAINGHTSGNLKGSVATLTIAGRVDKNVDITVDNLTLNSGAAIGGNLSYTSRNEASIQSGATVSGTTNRTVPQDNRFGWVAAGIAGTLFSRIFGFLSIFIIGLIFIFVMPRRTRQLAQTIRYHPAPCLGWGALIFFVTPIAAFIVMFTIIGIPLALISLAVWGILIYLSQIPVALIIGWLILAGRRGIISRKMMVASFALGLFILYVISLIPVFGWIMWLFVFFFGLGSLLEVFRAPRPAE